ncbi:MAG TPA: CAP domain-containing protein, partial [Anaerolineae bacterium]
MQKLILLSAFVLLLVAMTAQGASAQSPDAVADLAARVNRERLARGLVPYALNAKLTAAAQAHANDIARTGNFSHTGSDGSTVFDRVA